MKENSLFEYAFIPNMEDKGIKFRENVAIAKKTLLQGTKIVYGKKIITVANDIHTGGIFSVQNIKKGDNVIFLGAIIGQAAKHIKAGELINDGINGNITTKELPKHCNAACKSVQSANYDPLLSRRTFKGFRCKVTVDGREGGGTENIIAILNTVKCSAVAAKNIAHLARKILLPKYPNVTDVVAITQESGCGMPRGKSREELLRILIRIMNHPNIRAVYLLGLGCEHLTPSDEMPGNIIPVLRSEVIDYDKRVIADSLQRYKSEIHAINYIINGPLKELFSYANKYRRELLPLSYITLGLKCGGSDIFSGISSNIALGVAVDKLVKAGGAAIITETPEFDGYMHIIAERARNKKIASKLVGLLPRFDKLSRQYPIPGNGRQRVAPGNRHGGLLNIFVKSASAAQKCGTSPIEGVLDYADWIYDNCKRGLWVLDCPSYDQISTPALGLSGSQIVAFTTGLGTPIGSALSQVVKIGNRREIGLKNHVDFFAEDILHGKSAEEVGARLFEFIVSVASGDKITKIQKINRDMTKRGFSELHHEFMLWKRWGDN
jgi:altronate hydrolase